MYHILRATEEHQETVAQLFNQYRQFYTMPSDLYSANKFIENRLKNQDSLLYIAQHYNKPYIGSNVTTSGFVQIFPSFSSVAMKPIWIINDLYVTQESRRTGCARQLMMHLEYEAKLNNIFSLKLATALNNTKAKTLYESLCYNVNNEFQHYSKLL